MPQLIYKGDYGSSKTLSSVRTTSLALDGTLPTGPILVSSAYARLYVSTTRRPYTYQFHVETNDGYTGDKSYQFANVDEVVYVNVPISVTALDPDFPIRTINTISVKDNSGNGESVRIRGTVRIYVNYVNVTAPVEPQNVRINGTTAINLEADKTAQLTWDASQISEYDTLTAYSIRRYDVANDEYTVVGTTTNTYYTITAPYTDSKSYYYYIDVVTANWSVAATTFVSIFTFIQLTAPVIYGGGENPVYNPRPMLLVELGEGPIDEFLTLTVQGWTPSRLAYPGEHIYLRRNTTYRSATEETITITESDELMRSITTTLEVDYAPPAYTNPSIVAGATIVLAADITELQEAFDNIRAAYDMEAYTWTPCEAGITSLTLWPTHISELQACAREIRDYVNAWDTQSGSWAVNFPTLITTPGPSADVINQLRSIVTML